MYYVVLHSAWWFLCQHIWSSNHLFSLKIFLNLIPVIQQVLPCFPMSGAIVSFQFLIPELPLLWVCTVSQVEPTVLLNAAVSLASPPGAQRWQALPRQLRSPECHSLLLRGRAGADIRVPLPSAVLLGWWEPLLWVVGGGPALWMPPWLEAGVPGSSVADAHWPVSVGTAAAGAQGHMAISSAATGFSGAAGSTRVAGGQDCGHHLCCGPGSSSFLRSSPPTFRYTDIWIFWHPECVGQSCSVELWMFNWLLIEGERQRMHLNPSRCWYQYHYLFLVCFWPHLAACETSLTRGPGIEPVPPQWKWEVLTIGPQGKPNTIIFLINILWFESPWLAIKVWAGFLF